MRQARIARLVSVAAAALLLLVGCRSPAAQRRQLASSNPLDAVTAAVALAEAGDAGAVARLVSLLEDRDRAVRMYAILALERLCGQTHGYKYYEPEPARAEAVRRWQAALRQGEVVIAARPRPAQSEARAPGAAQDKAAAEECEERPEPAAGQITSEPSEVID